MDWINNLPPWVAPILAALTPVAMQYLHTRGYLPMFSKVFKWLANAAAEEEAKAIDDDLATLTPKLLVAHAVGDDKQREAIAAALRSIWGVAEPSTVKFEAK